MKRLLIAVLFIIVLILPGCVTGGTPDQGETPEDGEEVPDKGEIPDEEEIPDGNILQGYSLAELGVTVDLEKLRTFEDPNHSRSSTYGVITSTEFPVVSCRFPGTSILTFSYVFAYSIDAMDALYLQGIYKPTDTETEHFVSVQGELYSLTELVDFTIYEDDKIIVFDITDLLPLNSFEERLESVSELEWMIEVYEYLITYEDISIVYLGEESPGENVLQGYSLEELGVTVDLEKLRTFEDPNDSRYTPDYWVTTSSMFPGTSKLMILYTDNQISMEEIEALYMQGVYTPADPENECFLEIDGQRYSLSDLENFTIYQDEKIAVFDVTDFLPINSFEESIERYAQDNSSYSYDWLLEVYGYLKTYEDIAIIYQE